MTEWVYQTRAPWLPVDELRAAAHSHSAAVARCVIGDCPTLARRMAEQWLLMVTETSRALLEAIDAAREERA